MLVESFTSYSVTFVWLCWIGYFDWFSSVGYFGFEFSLNHLFIRLAERFVIHLIGSNSQVLLFQ